VAGILAQKRSLPRKNARLTNQKKYANLKKSQTRKVRSAGGKRNDSSSCIYAKRATQVHRTRLGYATAPRGPANRGACWRQFWRGAGSSEVRRSYPESFKSARGALTYSVSLWPTVLSRIVPRPRERNWPRARLESLERQQKVFEILSISPYRCSLQVNTIETLVGLKASAS
jgi:hypothetical protein